MYGFVRMVFEVQVRLHGFCIVGVWCGFLGLVCVLGYVEVGRKALFQGYKVIC